MFRNRLLGGISYLPLFAPEDEKRTPAQIERDNIEVVTNGKTKQADGLTDDKEPEVKEPEEKEPEEKEPEVKEPEKDVKNNKDEIETSKEKIDNLEEELKDETLTAKQRERLENRITKERQKVRDLRAENEELKRRLEAKPTDEGLSEEEIQARIEEGIREGKARDKFAEDCDKLFKAGTKIDKEFKSKINEMAADIGNIPSIMIAIMSDPDNEIDNGGAILNWMADNTESAEDLYALKNNPARLAIKLKEASEKLKAKEARAAKKETKEISKVPDPKEPLGGKGDAPTQRASEKDDMDTFVAKRALEAENHRRKKHGLPLLPLH